MAKGAMDIQIRRVRPRLGSGIGDSGLEKVLVKTICMHTTTTIGRIPLRDRLYTTSSLSIGIVGLKKSSVHQSQRGRAQLPGVDFTCEPESSQG